MKLTDEILNKYLDGELSSDELKELNLLLENDADALTTLKTHRFVDKTLTKIESDKAPAGITQKVMNIIAATSVVKNQKNYFFRFILILFALLISSALIITYLTASSVQIDSGTSISVLESTKTFFSDQLSNFSKLKGSNLLLLIGGFLTFVLIITGYFVLESHKSFKQKLESSF